MSPKCYLCESTKAEIVESGIRYDPTGEVWKCQTCGLVFLWPIPTEKELSDYYSSQYRKDSGNKSVNERFEKNRWEAEERVKRLDLSNIHSILEIGSGSGAFLQVVRGANTVFLEGIEPDEGSRKWINENLNIPIYQSIWNVLGKKYDLIVMFHVLEHLREPIKFLISLRNILNPDGKIVIEVPNVRDIMLYLRPYRKAYFFQKSHLYYFNKDTLSQICEKAGFSSIITGIQRYNLGSCFRWNLYGKNRGDGNYKDLRQSWVSRIYAGLLTWLDRSDTLWAEARGQ